MKDTELTKELMKTILTGFAISVVQQLITKSLDIDSEDYSYFLEQREMDWKGKGINGK